jgi:UDP-N-acetyl-2-amino-2-deoxyglucuronate dehydrogenase
VKTPLRFLLIGCGHIGQRHAQLISELAHLCGVCDLEETRANNFGNQYDVPYFTDHLDLLQSVEADAVAVCTPNGLHARHSISALEKGLHVLCEKPMALSGKDCREIIASAETNRRLFYVVKQNRYNPPVIYLRKLLGEGLLGRVYSIQVNCYWNRDRSYYQSRWKGTKSMDGGVLFTQFSHFIDILFWLFGNVNTIKSVSKNSGHQNITEFDDNGIVALEFENGTLGGIHYTTNAAVSNMEGSLTVFAEKGTLKIGGKYLNTIEYHQIPGLPLPQLGTANPANHYGTYEGSMGNHGEVYRQFIHQLNSGHWQSNSLDALRTVEIIERIHLNSVINPAVQS